MIKHVDKVYKRQVYLLTSRRLLMVKSLPILHYSHKLWSQILSLIPNQTALLHKLLFFPYFSSVEQSLLLQMKPMANSAIEGIFFLILSSAVSARLDINLISYVLLLSGIYQVKTD